VRAEQAPVDPIYANITILTDGLPFDQEDRGTIAGIARWAGYQLGDTLGVQATGGSTSVRDAWETMRIAGASARAMLIEAAAKRWNVAAAKCSAEEGFVLHASSDIAEKARGTAQFGVDTRLPGMLYAAIAHCPVFGGKLKSVDADKVKSMRGVAQVVPLPPETAAVAVVADRYWNAKAARAVLPIVWDHKSEPKLSSELIYKQYAKDLEQGKAQAYRNEGDAQSQLKGAAQVIEAQYQAPLLAHATMEPINCTARVTDRACEVWLGNQAPSLVRWIAGKTAGVDSEKITVHTPYLGGGFGRRAEMDVVVEAVRHARPCSFPLVGGRRGWGLSARNRLKGPAHPHLNPPPSRGRKHIL
jgi:isoquinoline 1-oxidoreductase subunit beta